ncbi:MAG: hypothetical protein AMXMBFR20_23120 [Planctomycetia bacterium]
MALGLLAATLGSTAAPLSAGEIRVWPTAVVKGSSVLLSDISALRGFNAETDARLLGLSVFTAPRAGGQISISADDIRAALVEADFNLADISIFGASRCRVSKPAMPAAEKVRIRKPTPKPIQAAPAMGSVQSAPAHDIAEESDSPNGTLETALRDFIAARGLRDGGRIEIRFSPASAGSLRIAGPAKKFRIHPRSEQRLGLVSFDVDILERGSVARTVPIVAEVALMTDVIVARRSINRGETVEPRALRIEERRFTDQAAIGLTELSAAVGMESRGFIRAGEMLTASALQTKPVVLRGQPVTIWMRQGALVIRASGKAQQSGSLGDRVSVLRDGTRRKQDVLEGVVTGPGTISVEPSAQATIEDTRVAWTN